MKDKLSYDAHVPVKLKRNQEWFASIITRPIDKDSLMNLISPTGKSMVDEAKVFIRPSPTLQSHQRIQIYNQQYWWRLLGILHENFPLVTRLFGHEGFNDLIGVPYLVKYPPRHWSLNLLGDRLTQWVDEEYHADDRFLILDAASIDTAFNDSFLIQEMPPLSITQLPNQNMNGLLDMTLYLQPHLKLFSLPYDLFALRAEMIKEDGDFWVDHDFPDLAQGRDYYFVLYRNARHNVCWDEISKGEYYLLQLFKSGTSVDEACVELESQNLEDFEEIFANLAFWFQKWILRSWLSIQNLSL